MRLDRSKMTPSGHRQCPAGTPRHIDHVPSEDHLFARLIRPAACALRGMVNVSQLFMAFARTTGQQRKPWHPRFVQAKDHDMRDFRDVKAMAGTLRTALAAKGLKITVSESLEPIAQAF